jgi:hypothetical protein
MDMKTIIVLAAILAVVYFLLAALGHFVVGGCMWFIRWTTRLPKRSFEMSVFWVGTTERLVTMVLFGLDRDRVVWFIGAWVALKFALNYKRREMKEDADYKQAMLALVGNVLSFGYALVAAYLVTPSKLI